MHDRRSFAFFASYVLGGFFASNGVHADDPAPGVWQEHKYSFAFMGFTSTYSCDGLADKLKILLIASGARRDAKAWPGACASDFGHPDKLARADLTFYTLAPAGNDQPADGIVQGTWRPIEFADMRPRELATGDCELVEQFKSNVLPMFHTRKVETSTTCVPHQLSGSTINLKFESFTVVAAKAAKSNNPSKPAT